MLYQETSWRFVFEHCSRRCIYSCQQTHTHYIIATKFTKRSQHEQLGEDGLVMMMRGNIVVVVEHSKTWLKNCLFKTTSGLLYSKTERGVAILNH